MSTANPPRRTRYLGIDISKARLDACLLPSSRLAAATRYAGSRC